jgi:hypothetical protein
MRDDVNDTTVKALLQQPQLGLNVGPYRPHSFHVQTTSLKQDNGLICLRENQRRATKLTCLVESDDGEPVLRAV